ncbi:hypothetical protein [Ralstonia pseudosolanacearum]|uniref:hypothetical protein n=1 Tax=Ralstonia pseudosolanacearum TaxID=1310165 RepID=UPI0016193307|nr:hypothetical protein [Ralstonia pseudosolanacearum]MDK1380764.1 hypothetical protein [Ralstonia pseudosolanacearum]MDO3522785.1 hypothetical protein [Ralstonia pseudosolanacearum]MDO3549351.1 hypothetical protein [Ralstonia pseudosolanacearum]MDO3552815.1 hypothetical protein [Ralstonia pseudosolanacearum]MDO3569200.1 hypothetical protein [Ralstonia pseudosolanacearum]
MFGDLPHLNAPQGFFTAPLTFTHGRFDQHGHFHPIVEACGAVRCHLSPVDALIEVVQMMQIGMECQVVPAAVVDHSHFKDAHGSGYRADMHLGWLACNGKLMPRLTGRLRWGQIGNPWRAHFPERLTRPRTSPRIDPSPKQR